MEENKNSADTIDNQPTMIIGDGGSGEQQSIALTPNSNQAPQSPKPKKSKFYWLLVTFGIIVSAFIVFNIIFSIYDFYHLKSVANQRAATLEELFENKGVAYPQVNGDYFTADKNPDRSSTAVMSFDINAKLKPTEQDIDNKLQNAGFVKEEGSLSRYYKLSRNYSANNDAWVTTRYLNAQTNEAIRVEYIFKNTIECPIAYTCEYTPDTKNVETIYPYSNFENQQVKNVRTSIGASSNRYATNFR